MALLESIDGWLSPDADFEAFFDLIWDIEKEGGAKGYGLDVWGRIVGVKRVLQAAPFTYFGFGEATDRTGFDQAPFYDGQPLTTNVALSDEVYRLLIFAKAAYNITDGSIPAINKILMGLFPNRGNCYVTDGHNAPRDLWFGFGEAGDRASFGSGPFMDSLLPSLPNNMTLTYVFEFVLQPFEIAIVTQSGALPKPVGVLANSRYLT